MNSAIGRRSAARQIRLRVPAPTANRSASTGPERERRREGVGLRAGKGPTTGEDRTQQLQQSTERDFLLRLDTRRPQQLHVTDDRGGPVEQRGLADARLTGQHQHTALADPGAGQQRAITPRSDSRPINM